MVKQQLRRGVLIFLGTVLKIGTDLTLQTKTTAECGLPQERSDEDWSIQCVG